MSQSCVMSPARRARRKRPVRRRFGPEVLESRHLPSAALPGIIATDPADGATPLQAPPSFTVTLDPAVVARVDAAFADLFAVAPDQLLPTIVAGDTGQDVEIDRVGPDGQPSPYLGGSGAPVNETVTTSTAADGTTLTQIVLTASDNIPPPGPGTYQVALSPTSNLAAIFGMIEPDSAWATATAPIPVAQFTILGRGPSLADASDLGVVDPKGQTVSGVLDPANYQSAVSLYRFTLPQGRSWQLDAAAFSSAIGSPLLPELTLLDGGGQVLATRDPGTGPAADPIDPVLITGLPGGTYYIGVSAGGNVPGAVGGYDPVSGRPGINGLAVPSGRFVLDVSATPVVPATQLVDLKLDYADSLETAPSELDLTFSGPVDVSPLTQVDRQESALSVVDAAGRTWPITAVDYQASQHRLSLLFDEPLPPGTYTLMSPSQGGLTDLNGRPVVGPAGSASGMLATWTVAAPAGPADPQNLGILWPGAGNVTWDSSISRDTALGTGQEVDYRFVVICPGEYALQTRTGGHPVEIGIEDSQGGLTLLSSPYFHLDPGVYRLQMISGGSQPAVIHWTLKPVSLDYEEILDNGVGQSPALALAGPAPGVPGPSPVPGPTGGSTAGVFSAGGAPVDSSSTGTPTTAVVSTGAIPAPGGAGPGGIAASPLPAALLVTPESAPAGLPSPDAGHVAVVGPLADGATVALTDAGRGRPPGFRITMSSLGADPQVGEDDPTAGTAATPTGPLTRIGPARPVGAADPQSASARADVLALALAQADPLIQVAGWLAGRVSGPTPMPREADLSAADFAATLLASTSTADDFPAPTDASAAGRSRGRARDTLAHADLGAPCALLVATALTYRLSAPVRKWWRRYHAAHAAWPPPYTWARGTAQPKDRC